GGQCVYLGDRFLQCADDILVRVLVETDVAVADLHETEVLSSFGSNGTEHFGGEHSTAHRPKHPGPGPSHAFQKAATIDTIVFLFMVMKNVIRHNIGPWLG